MKLPFRLTALAAAAAALCAYPTRAAVTTIDGRIVIPVDALDFDDEGDALAVKGNLLSSGGEVARRF